MHGQLATSGIAPEHPAIRYEQSSAGDSVARLSARLAAGDARLTLEPGTGYLRSLLQALDIPVESQIVVFSKTSLQANLINPRNPRAIYFNDSVAVGWMPGGFIEMAAHDPAQGAVFYTLRPTAATPPRPVRDDSCVRCHYASATLGVPGFMLRSIPSGRDGSIMPWLGNYTTTHRSPLGERWAGWYVTGRSTAPHLGNAPVEDRNAPEPTLSAELDVATLADRFDTRSYLSPHSDVVALLVFEHQAHMMNLLTRIGWQARVMSYEGTPASAAADWQDAVEEVVDYLMFVDEAALQPVRGSSEFAKRFQAGGPRDRRGRSLRDLDLQTRLLTFRCSYMIYSPAFEALPVEAKRAIYRRIWEVLSGGERGERYARLPPAERRAILEILRDTKTDLPAYYSTTSQSP